MTPDEIKKLIKQGVQEASTANRFQLSGIPRHIHNNIDSPYTFQPIITYVGIVLEGTFGSLIQPTPELLPGGWTVSYQIVSGSPVQVYQVTHNLNTSVYSVVVTPLENNPLSPTFIGANIQINPNNFLVFFFDTKTEAVADSGFTFLLTNTANKVPTYPTYPGL